MPTYTWNATTLGQFVGWNTPADWLPQAVPNAADADVVIPEITDASGDPYDFDVTIGATESYLVHSLTLVDQTLILDGSLAIGAALTMGTGSEIDLSGSLSLGSLTNAGAIDIQGSGQISSPGSIDNQGEIIGNGLTLDFAGLQNDGTLIAAGSLEVDLPSGPGAFANLSGGTLSLGTYEALSGVLDLDVGADIVTDAAAIVLVGSASAGSPVPIIETTTSVGGSPDLLTQTLQTIATAGVLTLTTADFAGTAALTVAGVVQLESGTLSSPGLTIEPAGTVVGNGTITGPVTDNGLIEVSPVTLYSALEAQGGSMLIEGPVNGTGTIAILPAGEDIWGQTLSDTLELAGADANPVAFDDWNGVLVLDSPTLFTGTISGFTAGINTDFAGADVQTELEEQTYPQSDMLILAGLSAGDITDLGYTGTSAAGTLSFQDSGSSIALGFVGDYSLGDFVFSAGPQALSTSPPSVEITEVLPCFLAGTRLLTEHGEVPVERLAVGDLVCTPVSGGSAPVRWIGQRRIDASRHPRPNDVWPIRVRADAFGLGRPHRDLLLSPDHAIYVEGVLIPVRYLVNDATIVRTLIADAHYFHVELPHHDVVVAEGLPTESYLDLGNRGAFANGGRAVMLHPDFGARIWQREGCAELILGGPVLARVQARLRVQASLLEGARSLSRAATGPA